jgi:hypothetical protein
MSQLRPMIIVLLMLTSALAGCLDENIVQDTESEDIGLSNCNSGDGVFSSSMIEFDITNNPDFSNIGGIEYDCDSNLLYGYAWDSVEEVEHFISINTSTGVVSSVMRGNNIDYLVNINIDDPSQFTLIEFDFSDHPELDNVGGIEYNYSGDIIYGYAGDDSNSQPPASNNQPPSIIMPTPYVITINTTTGYVTKYSELENIDSVMNGGSSFDGSSYYLSVRDDEGGYSMANISVYDFSISTSTVIATSNEDLTSVSGFEINSSTGLIYGYGHDSVNEEWVFLSYDISTESILEIGVLTDVEYVTSYSTIGGADFYAIMAGSDRVNKLVYITY